MTTKCPYCYRVLGTWFQDPILLPDGSPNSWSDDETLVAEPDITKRLYKGVYCIKEHDIQSIQDNLKDLESQYFTESEKTEFTSLNANGTFQITGKHIKEMRDSVEKLLIKNGKTKIEYFNSDESNTHITTPEGDKPDWTDVITEDTDLGNFQVRAIHIEDLRRALLLLWQETWDSDEIAWTDSGLVDKDHPVPSPPWVWYFGEAGLIIVHPTVKADITTANWYVQEIYSWGPMMFGEDDPALSYSVNFNKKFEFNYSAHTQVHTQTIKPVYTSAVLDITNANGTGIPSTKIQYGSSHLHFKGILDYTMSGLVESGTPDFLSMISFHVYLWDNVNGTREIVYWDYVSSSESYADANKPDITFGNGRYLKADLNNFDRDIYADVVSLWGAIPEGLEITIGGSLKILINCIADCHYGGVGVNWHTTATLSGTLDTLKYQYVPI